MLPAPGVGRGVLFGPPSRPSPRRGVPRGAARGAGGAGPGAGLGSDRCRGTGRLMGSRPLQVQLINDAYNVVIDAILGADAEPGEMKEPYTGILATLKQIRIPIVSLDVPSGQAPREGTRAGPCHDGAGRKQHGHLALTWLRPPSLPWHLGLRALHPGPVPPSPPPAAPCLSWGQ